MTTPANEWREEFDKEFTHERSESILLTTDYKRYINPYIDPDKIKDFIQNLLDQHTAHLVERLKKMDFEYQCLECGDYGVARDQAIDIVKDTNNK